MDAILTTKWGVGVRVDAPHLNLGSALEIRYSVFSMPFVRVVGGAIVGLQDGRGSSGWAESFGGFLGARVSMGSPYLQAQLGVQRAYTPEFSAYSTIAIGMSL